MNKHGWTYKKLGEVADIVSGSTPKTNVPEFWGGNHYWVTPAELGDFVYIGETERTITDEALSKTNLTLMPIGTVLLSSRAPIGKTAITTAPMYCNQGFKNIICSSSLNNKFTYYYIGHIVPKLQSLGRGATFKEISKSIVEKTIIPVPPMAEQEAIVAELDEINETIAELQQQIADLDTLAQSTFYDMFGDPITNPKGWEVKKLGDVAHYSSTRVSATELNPSNYVGVDNLLKDKQGKIDASFYPTDGNVTAYKIGDTLLGNIRPYLKKIWYADSNGGASGDVLVIQVNEDMKSQIHPFFIYYTLSLDAFFDFDMLHSKGAKMPRGSKPEIMKFPICKPPLALQQEFASRVEAIEAAKSELNAQIAEMQTLLASRMDYYFD